MHSIRFQFLAFISVIMLVLLILLNILPIASSRDLVFEEKRDSLSSQAAVIASSLSGLERLSQESITEVLRIRISLAFPAWWCPTRRAPSCTTTAAAPA